MSSVSRGLAYWLTLLAALAAIGGVAGSLWSRAARSLDEARGGRLPAGYADDASCAVCHADIAASYARSGMGQAWRRWSDATLIEDRTEPSAPRSAGSFQYQVLFRDGRQRQHESRAAEGADDFETLSREATYVLGSGMEGRAYVASDNGYLTIMPLSWYTDQGRWDLSPNYDRHNQRFSRAVQPGCIACHNGVVGFVAGSTNCYAEPLPSGLGCQRCHGPAADHVAEQSGLKPSGSSPNSDGTFVNPAKLAADRAQDVCLQCHLLGDISIMQPGYGEWDFRPGMRLADVRSDFIADSEDAAFRAVGHGPRSMASECFRKSGGQMTCIFCHDPHRPSNEPPPSFYNQKCLACHSSRGCRRPVQVDERADAGDCVACHMPKRDTADITHAVATEHWIRRTAELPAPPRATQPATLKPFWPETSDGQLGSAIVEYFAARGELAAVERGVGLLEQSLESTPGVAEWLWRLGYGQLLLGRIEQALRSVDRAIAAKPNLDTAQHLRGEVLVRFGRKTAAIAQFEKVLELWPRFYEADARLAKLYLDTGRPQRLVEMEERFFREHPADAERLGLVARALEKMGRPAADVDAALDRAIAADGARASPHLWRAELAVRRGDVERVEPAIRLARRAEPDSTAADVAWAGLMASRGQRGEAIATLQNVLAREPNHAAARRMLQNLDAASR